ncbi:DNA-binding response regulator [Pseudomethylobacillus aquaticus]|uniref:DNA-binding response regulator n=1 Tax=Pseudomethylobacillus aquaticus TaxID=2676064 RepID=A0A3N0V5L8_9PROT|nr:response regulator transcription factor [Pseudomethylobacillus aquaticus]ROH88086.1 DNA-binding response regulator [Pseudomethylobacillus aquaticus]
MKFHILVVEDNADLRDSIVETLQAHGHHVLAVECAEEVAETRLPATFDLMIADVGLPGEDGISLSRRIRLTHPNIGIIMLTARVSQADRLAGYECGADIYLTKPASQQELLAAIHVLMRRVIPAETSAQSLLLDIKTFTLSKGQATVKLTAREVTLLLAFLRASDHRLESWQIIEILELDELADPKASAEVQIVRLRKKINEVLQDAASSIQSLRGWGYQLGVTINIL